jgi:hypothetical protein
MAISSNDSGASVCVQSRLDKTPSFQNEGLHDDLKAFWLTHRASLAFFVIGVIGAFLGLEMP